PCLPPRVGRCPAWPGPRPPLARPPRRSPAPRCRPGPRPPRPDKPTPPTPPLAANDRGAGGAPTRRIAMLTEPTRRDPYRIPPEAIADAEPIIRELATDFALEAAASGDHAL